MDPKATRGSPMLVERKNVEARRLAARGRLRDALNTLNEAIYTTPAYPHLYATRAIVFDRLGMFPQAEADRERALNLAREGGYTEEEVFADPEPPRPPPATPPPEVLAGSPYAFSSLQNAWQAKGLTVAAGALSGGFNGFKKPAFDVNLAHTGGNASLSVLIYGSPDDPKEDWDLPSGSRPSPKEGRSLPGHETIWWNSNVIIVVRSSSGDANNTALEAFLNASP